MKQAVLFLSDKSSQWIVDNFKKLEAIESETTDVFFLYHERNELIPEVIQSIRNFTFTDQILHELDYHPIKEKLVPGSNHFPLLKFYLEKKQYDYYWMIEDDVCFNGNWEVFFEFYQNNTTDFISSHISKYDEIPEWYWWFALNTADKQISKSDKVRSFNPVYRLSNRALELIDQSLKNEWFGHHEVLIPTLLYNSGFTLTDMGGTGSFVPKGLENQFYTNESHSYLPVEFGDISNCIYHPIKEKKVIDLNALKKYCVISSVCGRSLHREWLKGLPDFDLHIIIFDNSYNQFYKDTDFISYQQGYKFKVLYDYLIKNPEYLEKYEYFFVPDYKIMMDADNISILFKQMQQYDLQIAQPALSDSYYSYLHTIKDRLCKLRFTNFVEMMAPCFSRDALKKVLFTFNENNSAGGIEFHWSQLIGFTGREMAIIDDIKAALPRPIWSYDLQHITESNSYLEKFKLSREIKEYGTIPIDIQAFTEWLPVISKREDYAFFDKQLAQIANTLLQTLHTNTEQGGLLEGAPGLSLFFLNYYRLTGKRKYLDQALSIVDRSCEEISLFKDDLSFSTGLSGFSWYIEYLAQNAFIDNDTDEVLEEICEHMNKSYVLDNEDISFPEGIIGYGQHYLARMSNSNFDIQKELNSKEKNTLLEIISRIEKYYMESFEQKSIGKINNRLASDCLLFLSKANQLMPENNTIKIMIGKFAIKLKQGVPSMSFSAMQKAYSLYIASKILDDILLRDFALNIARVSIQATEISDFESIHDIHLLNRLYQDTKYSEFKDTIQEALNLLFAKDKINHNINTPDTFINKDKTINANITNGLTGLGLITISAMADFKQDWDSCILL